MAEHETGAADGTTARIVVGVDDSPGARVALAFALREAALRGARVDAVTAFLIPPYLPGPYGLPPQTPPTPLDELRAEAHAVASRVVEEVRATLTDLPEQPDVTVRAVGGHAVPVLVDASAGADMLVVGSRGHGEYVGMLIGSVSLHCALHGLCPVTVVRRPAAPRRHGAPAGAEPVAAGRST